MKKAFLICTILFFAQSIFACVVLDQFYGQSCDLPVYANPNSPDSAVYLTGGFGFYEGVSYAQTFKPGVDGQLVRVEIAIELNHDYDPCSIIFDIRNVVAGIPTDSSLGKLIFPDGLRKIYKGAPYESLYNWAFLDFSDEEIFLNKNQEYALVIESNGQNSGWTIGNFRDKWRMGIDLYDQGTALQKDMTRDWGFPETIGHEPVDMNEDIAFRTYMNPSPIPEPGTYMLLGSGLLGLVGLARKK